jgi:hypothetical protein
VQAVLQLGLEHRERAVGEHRVVAPGGEQLALLGLLRPMNAVYSTSATSASDTSSPVSGSTNASG